MTTVLLTGGCGFIGHHTAEHILKNTDWNVVIIDRLNYAGSLNYLTDIEILRNVDSEYRKRLRIVYDDFRSPLSDLTLHLIGDVDYVIHMGAESHVDNSIANPEPFIMSNVVGTMNILEACKRLMPSKIIYVSTDEVYGPMVDHLHKEGEPHKPGNPYSASKAAAEDLCLAYWNTYGMPIVISNTMNNFGERQHPEKFVPKSIKAILLDQEVTAHCKIVENPETHERSVTDISSRCWLHARNHADALLFLLKNGNSGERYNVTGERFNVVEIINMIGNFLEKEPRIKYEDFHSFRRGHDMHYGLDGTKMKELGWTPPVPLLASLERTVLWLKENQKWLGL